MRDLLAVSSLVLALNSFSAFAVDAGQSQFSLGAGLNINFVNANADTGDFDEEASADLAIAGKFEYGFDDLWSLRTGLWLQEKTASFSINDDDGDSIQDMNGNTIYASVPLNVQLKINKMFSIFAGYIADFRINDYCSESGVYADGCYFSKDTESVVHTATLGASIWGNDKLQVDVSYTHGLTDVVDQKDGGYKIHTLAGMLFYKF